MTFLLALQMLLVPAMSWLDRQRGMPKDQETIPKVPALLLMGYACALLTGHGFDWHTLAIVAGVAVGHNASFGQPLGEALTGRVKRANDGTLYEMWQVGVLKSNCWLALVFRGVLVGATVLGLEFLKALGVFVVEAWNGPVFDAIAPAFLSMAWLPAIKIAIAFAIAFPLAPAIVRYAVRPANDGWAMNEYIRGALVGALLFGMVFV